MSELKKKFSRKIRRMSSKELEDFDEWFTSIAYDLLDFYDIKNELKSAEEKLRFIEYLYMYAIVYGKTCFDERYDQPLFSDALKYAKS